MVVTASVGSSVAKRMELVPITRTSEPRDIRVLDKMIGGAPGVSVEPDTEMPVRSCLITTPLRFVTYPGIRDKGGVTNSLGAAGLRGPRIKKILLRGQRASNGKDGSRYIGWSCNRIPSSTAPIDSRRNTIVQETIDRPH